MTTVDELTIQFTADIRDLKAGIRDIERELKGIDETSKQIKWLEIPQAISAFKDVAQPVIDFFTECVEVSSDAAEEASKFEQVFKESAESVGQWASETSDALGRSETTIKSLASGFQSLLAPMTGNRQQAAEMSKAYTQLAIDLSSFYNVSESDAADNLRSAIAGETEAVRKYGVMINDARLNQELLNMGLEKTTKNATEAEKQQARFNIIMRDTKDAQGDAARTADGYANSMRALDSKLTELKKTIGDALMPTIKELVKKFSEGADAVGPFLEGIKELSEAVNKRETQTSLKVMNAAFGETNDTLRPLGDWLKTSGNATFERFLDFFSHEKAMDIQDVAFWLAKIVEIEIGFQKLLRGDLIGATEEWYRAMSTAGLEAETADPKITGAAEAMDATGDASDRATPKIADAGKKTADAGAAAASANPNISGTGGAFNTAASGADGFSKSADDALESYKGWYNYYQSHNPPTPVVTALPLQPSSNPSTPDTKSAAQATATPKPGTTNPGDGAETKATEGPVNGTGITTVRQWVQDGYWWTQFSDGSVKKGSAVSTATSAGNKRAFGASGISLTIINPVGETASKSLESARRLARKLGSVSAVI